MFQRVRAPVSFDPFRTLLPATTVLEMSAEDVPKKYVRAICHALPLLAINLYLVNGLTFIATAAHSLTVFSSLLLSLFLSLLLSLFLSLFLSLPVCMSACAVKSQPSGSI